jgi:hypothetical protein
MMTDTLREQIVSRIDDVSGQFRLISNGWNLGFFAPLMFAI